MSATPRNPVYVISKGRADCCLTANALQRDGCPFRLVVEPQELEAYTARYPRDIIAVLPFSNLGLGSIPARNWVWEDARAAGHERHWILDDNIRGAYRRVHGGRRLNCNFGAALAITETFVDRYENIAIAGLNYDFFAVPGQSRAPFNLNCHVYSCLLILNSLPHRWRGRYNEDTDLCLQVLADGWCTVLMNAFLIKKTATMKMKGGNTDHLYQGDGRLRMARSLERMWPGVVSVKRRFKRPQHRIKYEWQRFDTPLRLKPGIDLDALPAVDDHGLKLVQVKPTRSKTLAAALAGKREAAT